MRRRPIRSIRRSLAAIGSSDWSKKMCSVQRLLWASTGTKNPDYSDVKYIEALIGPDTVNTIPVETLNAYRDHGAPEVRIEQDVEQAHSVLESLPTSASASHRSRSNSKTKAWRHSTSRSTS